MQRVVGNSHSVSVYTSWTTGQLPSFIHSRSRLESGTFRQSQCQQSTRPQWPHCVPAGLQTRADFCSKQQSKSRSCCSPHSQPILFPQSSHNNSLNDNTQKYSRESHQDVNVNDTIRVRHGYANVS